MSRRLRILTSLVFVALFLLIPAPDSLSSRTWLAVLQTREWLLGADGPLRPWLAGDALPPLRAELRLSPPDPALAQRFAADVERCAREWAAARAIEAAPAGAHVADASPALPLLLRVGEHGGHASMPRPDGGEAVAQWTNPDAGSLVPAFLAVILAILTGRVVPALLAGCLAGAMLTLRHGGAGALQAAALAPWHLVADTLWTDVLGRLQVAESGAGFQIRVILFVVFLFMAIGVMSRAGGVQGMVAWTARFARGPASTQLCAWVTGLLICFDDYSNCMIAGTTMQPLGDRNRVAREKIAYIVDSTAAPVAGLSIVSTWIAYEVSQYRAPLTLVTREDGTPYVADDAFLVFVQTLPFRFYCVFALLLVPLLVVLGRDFGPMLHAERRARREGKPVADDARPMVGRDMAALQAPPGTPLRARNGFLPVLLFVALAIGSIVVYGAWDEHGVFRVPAGAGLLEQVRFVLGNAAMDRALLWASVGALLLASVLALGQRLLTARQVVGSALRSTRSLGPAIVVLLLAWAIGQTCRDLCTSHYLTAAFRDLMRAELLPLLMFALSGLIAFATGTSYGTMAILLPNVVVLAHTIGTDSGFGGPALMVLTIGAVLEGSIFGDHCSPISDTTVLSSLATQCDHLHHVQTQLPYASLAMVTAAVCGYLPMVLLGPHLWWLSWLVGMGAMAAFLLVVGRRP